MRAYTDRILVTNIEEPSGTFPSQNGMQLKKVTIISAGDSPDGRSNKDLEGKDVLIPAQLQGTIVPDVENNRTLYLMRRTSIEIILD